MNHAYSIILILLLAMILFIWGRWRYDVVALIALFFSTLIGAIPMSQIYSGLDNPAVVTVACVMIISRTITNSGVLNRIISLIGTTTKSSTVHVGILSLLALLLSGFMNNIGALALIMPVAIKTALAEKKIAEFYSYAYCVCIRARWPNDLDWHTAKFDYFFLSRKGHRAPFYDV